ASYALRVMNQTPYALRAKMICANMRGKALSAFPLDVQIAPFSVSESLLPLRIADVGNFDRAVVHVSGGNVAFSLEAPAPPRTPAKSRFLRSAAAIVGLTLAAALAAAAATPRISLVGAPDRVLSGNALDVPYAFGGWASMQYALKTADGRQVTAGMVGAHHGTLHLSVPAAAGQNVVLSVNVAGPFGTRFAQQSIQVTPAPIVQQRAPRKLPAARPTVIAPRISEFAVVTPLVHAGGNVTFAYATNAREGEVWLIDEAGRLWARTPITPYGSSTINVPQAAAGRQMRAVLHARNGKLDDVASVGLTILPGASVTQPPPSVAHTRSTSQEPALSLSSGTVGPGDSVMVAIEGNHGDAQISLNDAGGNSIEQGDIPAGQEAVTLSAPSVDHITTFYIMANVTEGTGEQTLVKKLVVSPR
ncbi:MAG TPA: hypothetical protein VFE17_01245, partial [Candidatus Baltobacteraceae bacterium]|nr:hypothetical protein [Candidatus Baltobacteraceae bacterium]